MPTIDDLRDVLVAREVHAPEAVAIRPHRRRVLAPALAVVVVVTVATAAVVLAASNHSGQQAGGSGPSALTGSTPPASTAPPHFTTHLRWNFSVGELSGYTVTRYLYTPYLQAALITPTSGSGSSGNVAVHPAGVYHADWLDGDPQKVDGRTGYFLGSPAKPKLVWQYADNSWAEVDGTFGYDHATQRYDYTAARAGELTIARALTFGPSDVVTMPFRISLPSNFTLEATSTQRGRGCIGYGNGGPYDEAQPALGSILTVCRVRDTGAPDDPNPYLTQDLGDGTSLRFEVATTLRSDDLMSTLLQADKKAEVSPSLDDPSTWLPVG